jgi:hypothetical protein
VVIEWDQVIIENTLLAVIIVRSIYIEQWAHDMSHLKEEKRTKKRILLFIEDDLQKRLDFIKETYQYNDYKPFFTDMWDAVILTGKQALLPFELFQNLQRTYSWMKYYNSEIESRRGLALDEKVLKDLLEDVKKNIERSLLMLKQDTDLH